MRRLLAVLFVLLVASPAWADCTGSGLTWTCTAGSTAAQVNTAITSATSGATITLAAGTYTWTEAVYVTKSLTITGAGIDATIVNADTPGSIVSVVYSTAGCPNYFEISGMTMTEYRGNISGSFIDVGCTNAAGYPPSPSPTGAPPIYGVRIHHIKMYGDPTTPQVRGLRFITVGAMNGLVDHCEFHSDTSYGSGNVSANRDNTVSTVNSYHIPLVLGNEKALYMEDNLWDFGVGGGIGNGATDNYSGARFVVRYNTIVNNNVGNHGWDSQYRGVPSFEIYQNIFRATPMALAIGLFGPRSGTGIVWGNTIQQVQPQTSGTGYVYFFAPQYYGHATSRELAGSVATNQRSNGYYPTPPWGGTWNGMSTVGDGLNNKVNGSQPIDGNWYGPDHMDASYTRTVTDLVTTAGNNTLNSASASFTAADINKSVYTDRIKRGRIVTDGQVTSGSTTITSATANFTAGDVGRLIGTLWSGHVPLGTYIASVVNTTTATLTQPASSSGSPLAFFMPDSYIVSYTATSITLNTPAIASGSGGTLTLGFTDQGYPTADSVGFGAFPSANLGNWPLAASYSAANYQQLAPIYLWGNHWQTNTNNAPTYTVLSDTNPPVSVPFYEGSKPYIKRGREFYENSDTNDIGEGVFTSLPGTCTLNHAYWVTDRGGNWHTTNAPAQDGALYKCTATDTWTLFYTPYTYPHPLQRAGPAPSAPTNVRIR